MKPADYIKKYANLSVRTTLFSHLLPSVQIAQSILESGWGESSAAKNDNAFFGVKSHGKSGGVVHWTKEFVDGNYVDKEDSFRAYKNPKQSFSDHLAFLRENDRYKPVFEAKTYNDQTDALQSAGYATSPTYSQKLNSIIDDYSLTKFDFRKKAIKITLIVLIVLKALFLLYFVFRKKIKLHG